MEQIPVPAPQGGGLQLSVFRGDKSAEVVSGQRTAARHAVDVVADIGPVHQTLTAPVFPGAQLGEVARLLQQPVGGMQLIDRFFIVAHVMKDEEHAGLAVKLDQHRGNRARDDLAMGLAQNAQTVHLPLACQLVQQAHTLFGCGIDLQFGIGAPDDLFARQAQHIAQGWVDVDESPVLDGSNAHCIR